MIKKNKVRNHKICICLLLNNSYNINKMNTLVFVQFFLIEVKTNTMHFHIGNSLNQILINDGKQFSENSLSIFNHKMHGRLKNSWNNIE